MNDKNIDLDNLDEESREIVLSEPVSTLQLCLNLFTDVVDSRYSNAVDLYDLLPKHVNWKAKKSLSLENAEVVRAVTIQNMEYTTVLRPAIIRDGKVNKLVYPSDREKYVELALRKIAVDGSATISSEGAGVYFTLLQLQKVLKASGHGYNLSEIKEAIMICQGATLECKTTDGKSVLSSSIFPIVSLRSREEWEENPSDCKCLVMFNPLVSKSIADLTFRPYNYEKNMSLKSGLAQYLHKRMSMRYKQASENKTYHFRLMNMLEASGRGISPRMSENIRAMKNALDILVADDVIKPGYEDMMKREYKGRAIVDIVYDVVPTQSFISDTKLANKIQKQVSQKTVQLLNDKATD